MENLFFEKPILNSPYEYPARHWELDTQGQPTQQIIEKRRRAEYITPIPKPKKRKDTGKQQDLIFDEGKGLSTQAQQYDPTPVISQNGQYGRWAFAEFTEVYQIESDFKEKVEKEFNKMIDKFAD